MFISQHFPDGESVDAALLKAESAVQPNQLADYQPLDTTLLKAADVINTLDSDATDAPLSAAQGKALAEQINAIWALLNPEE